ncbi:MAG: amidohydrolase family protein [Saprospiraceae bacterium]
MIKRLTLLIIGIFALQYSYAQKTFPRNGVADVRTGYYAFTNATVYQNYNRKMDGATLLIKDGKVKATGTDIDIPKGAVVIDLKGKTIYPSFIDLHTNYGMPEVKKSTRKWTDGPQMLSKKDGAYGWNQALKPEFSAYENFTVDTKTAATLRKNGFGAVLSHQMDGISRGSSALVALGNERPHEVVLKGEVGHHLSFKKGSSPQDYPSSLMGAISLLRQTSYDANWYKNQTEESNISLEAWNEAQKLIQFFEVRDRLEALRAAKLGEEFGVTYIMKGSGDEYQRIDAIKASGTSLIIPVDFPAAYDVTDPYDAYNVSLCDMKHWKLAPTNAARLAQANITFAFTADGLKKKDDFLKMIRKVVKHGLSKESALRALTYGPARMIQMTEQIGSLQDGRIANFIITDKDIFADDARILENWVQGKRMVATDATATELAGDYELKVNGESYDLKITSKSGKHDAKIIVNDSTKTKVALTVNEPLMTIAFQPEGKDVKYRLSGTMEANQWTGRGQIADGEWVKWTAASVTKTVAEKEKEKKVDDEKINDAISIEIPSPFMAYGWTEQPQQQTYLITNATVWTNEAEGIVENANVLVENGKIAAVGKDVSKSGVIAIDGTGKHLTTGIIDEHSHIAISRGVNEGTQASSAEVSISDVVNSDDINIYRQLAGGVTAAQLLHGSANPIGGQSAIIKLRWGWTPEEMKIKGADGFIKFALGENVKQSHWGDANVTRFPQTRMGVEQVFEDHFTRAKEYEKQKQRGGSNFRKDLEMEALLEIINSKRFISCHSYQQSEINMLMKVAERHGFTVNTFTHILEGYKVADKMAKHGAAGSTFSDWWAYKYEVIDAIPQNGEIMHEQGVLTAFNSDDAEMARRLNQEAGKAVMYGDISEEEAWKFVTLNPAKILHLDDRMGSIKVGKDADLVLWSDHPMSIYAKAEYTFVDGRKLFDREADSEMQKMIAKERADLIQEMLEVKKKGGKTQPVKQKNQHLYHCDDIHDEIKD